MNTAVINIKTNPEIKEKAQEVAQELGLSLSAIINAYLNQLIKTKTVTFSASDEEPTEYLLQMLKESKEDIKARRVSPSFDNVEESFKWLEDQHARYQNGDKVQR